MATSGFDKQLLLELVWRRADAHRSASHGVWETFPMLFGFMVSVLIFSASVLVVSQSATVSGYPAVALLALFASLIFYLGIFAVVGRPLAAVEKWTAERCDALADIYLFDAISQVECLSFLDQISVGHASWKRRSAWKMYWALKGGRTAAIKAGAFQPGVRVTRGADTIRFVAGEIGGPWEYLH